MPASGHKRVLANDRFVEAQIQKFAGIPLNRNDN